MTGAALEALEAAAAAPGQVQDLWHSILEVNPSLNQCRLLLQRRNALEESDAKPVDHRQYDVHCRVAEGCLEVSLSAAADASVLRVPVCDSLQVHADGVRASADHICVVAALGGGAAGEWLEELLQPCLADRAPEVGELLCRSCAQSLLQPGPGRQSFLLPTTMWQACAEVMACEECAPLGVEHVVATPGRVYLSPQCLTVSSADLRLDAVSFGADGLVRCVCRQVIGETQGPVKSQPAQARRGKVGFCGEAWGHSCRTRGLALYKHRVSMPLPCPCREESLVDGLASVTEAAAVAAQLLSLRAAGGHSRFVLLPGPPEGTAGGGAAAPPAAPAAEAVELRIVVAELFLRGPVLQDGRRGHDVDPAPGDAPHERAQRAAGATQRAAKVGFRLCPCTSLPAECQVLGVPQVAFDGVLSELRGWARRLPASHALSPLSSKDGRGLWTTSLLPLPPRDGGAE